MEAQRVVCSSDTQSCVQINGTETEDSELDTHKYSHRILNKGTKAMQQEKSNGRERELNDKTQR